MMRGLPLLGCLFVVILIAWTAEAQLFGPYRWRDSKGNCVAATRGTLEGKPAERRQFTLEQIGEDFLGGWWSNSTDKEYVRGLSEQEQNAFFRAIQRVLAESGKGEYRLRFPQSFTVHFGVPNGFDVVYPVSGPPEGHHCGG